MGKTKTAQKHVDCIIITMLQEERKLFLNNNIALLYDKNRINNEFLEFEFFDKENKLRKGVFCSGNDKMGNSEACALFYKLSRKYKADLYLNIGVVGFVNDVSIGDVIIVNDNYSLAERNASNSNLQKTDFAIETDYIQTITNEINNHFSKKFCNTTRKRLQVLRSEVDKYIEMNRVDDGIRDSLSKILSIEKNTISLGCCATYHSVVKDKKTRKKISDIRKTKIIDMESYYFNLWHELVKKEEPNYSCEKSHMIMIKSVSDTALDKEKKILEECGSRSMAMNNIYDIVSFLITSLYEFSSAKSYNTPLYDYFSNHISNNHLDRLTKNSTEASVACFDKICPFIVDNKEIGGIQICGEYIRVACEILSKKNSTLILQGSAGKGKSTFISLLYQSMINHQNKAILFNLSKAIEFSEDTISVEQCLDLLKRLIKKETNLVVFIDGVEGNRAHSNQENTRIQSQLLDMLKRKTNQNVGICIGGGYNKYENNNSILNFLPEQNNTFTMVFRSISSFDNNILVFIDKFADLYKLYDSTFDKPNYIRRVTELIQRESFVLQYIDFRLLYMFARDNQNLSRCDSVFEFIYNYCCRKTNNNIKSVTERFTDILKGNSVIDETGLLTKNIYSRAYIFSEYISNAFYKNDQEKIKCIMEQDFILSDNINSFINYRIHKNRTETRTIVLNIIDTLKSYSNPSISAVTQLIYILSLCLDFIDNSIKDDIQELIANQLVICGCETVDCSLMLKRRTLSIILGRYYNKNDYLDAFLEDMLANNRIMRININFHLYYYSQFEFNYDEVESFKYVDSEIVYNTYNRLLNFVLSSKQPYTSFDKMCLYSLIYLLYYTMNDTDKYKKCASITHETILEIKEKIDSDFKIFIPKKVYGILEKTIQESTTE